MKRFGVKSSVHLTLLVLLFCCMNVSCPAAEHHSVPPQEVAEAALNGAKTIMELKENDFGKVELGQAFPLYETSLFMLESAKTTAELDSALSDLAEWYYLIKAEKKPFALLHIITNHGKWTMGEFGHKNLAAELSAILNEWPAKDGYDYRLIKVMFLGPADIPTFVVIVKGQDILGAAPLLTSKCFMKAEETNPPEKKLYPIGELSKRLKASR